MNIFKIGVLSTLTLLATTVFASPLTFQESSIISDETLYRRVNDQCYSEYYSTWADDSEGSKRSTRAQEAHKRCPIHEYDGEDFYRLIIRDYEVDEKSVYSSNGELTVHVGDITERMELRASLSEGSDSQHINFYLFENNTERDKVRIIENQSFDGGYSRSSYFLNERLELYVFNFSVSEVGYQANYWKKYQIDIGSGKFQLAQHIGCE